MRKFFILVVLGLMPFIASAKDCSRFNRLNSFERYDYVYENEIDTCVERFIDKAKKSLSESLNDVISHSEEDKKEEIIAFQRNWVDSSMLECEFLKKTKGMRGDMYKDVCVANKSIYRAQELLELF